MSYEPHQHLVTPARTHPELWRLAVGAAFGLAVYLAFLLAYTTVVQQFASLEWLAGALTGETPLQVYVMLGSFVGMVAGAVGAAALHHRGLRSLVGGYRRTLRGFVQGMVGIAPILAGLVIFSLWTEDTTPNIAPVLWALLLPISLTFLLIQVSAEELVFRGYLQSQLAAMNLPPVLWMLIPSILFGLAHYDPTTLGEAAPLVVIWATIFGVLTADLTARTGTLGPAIAMHFANNMVAMLILGTPDHLGGLALFHYGFSLTDSAEIIARLPQDAIGMALLYLAIRLRLKV